MASRHARDRDMLAEDIRRNRPDIIVVERMCSIGGHGRGPIRSSPSVCGRTGRPP
jgi:hypothetical protein